MSNNKLTSTIYWHDYETFGIDPALDRPAQFAGVRTDEDLNIIEEPLVIYCKPANDYLPQAEACLITGITPQTALEKGVCEAEFISRINDEFSRPKTCVAGYNSIRFDDEVTRHTLYRNFHDPYAREWQNGNSRWDIIDLTRMARALRPEGINWPNHDDGKPSFRLEELTAINNIKHQSAHDALSDVYATIEWAKLIREKQPKLYHYLYQNRDKHSLGKLLNVAEKKPVLHVSGMYPANKGCLAIVSPLAQHPVNKNGVIAYDLSVDPGELLSLSVDEIKARLFTPAAELPEGVERIPLKTIHLNKCPAIAPLGTLSKEIAKRYELDVDRCRENLQIIKKSTGLEQKIAQVMESPPFEKISDPDKMLYSGGFFSNSDRSKMVSISKMVPEKLAQYETIFEDARLPEMLFRYRARNYPETLISDESEQWEVFRRQRLLEGDGKSLLT
ncbi:MAG: exodeoxyribonuclease I, partial [Gammaproteobacteria bacterium]